ncbi:hypothetical protein [Xylocopilactobacillus apis]|uniref:Uncharacterized protein n=1 Tax=Xylocopilactobacillus apis TaxID=2932183 RepID=A0AAU9DH18_9LACO|nr:hypothetical protein [Xylocopilactobacillus apis]BDR56037.1 hypothetical protein KIMC2_05990 [Xylocopilactobacillus apis]
MKKSQKNSLMALAIILVALIFLGGSFMAGSKLKHLRDHKRVQTMYHLLSTKGKLHTERNSYTYLTEIGKKRLQSNLTFDKKGLPDDTLTAYSEEKLYLIPYNYEGQIKLPDNPKKGQRLYFKAPFPLTVNDNLELVIYYKNKTVHYDSTNVLTKKKKKKNVGFIYLGESSDSKGELIDDIKLIKNQADEKVRFKIVNFERSYDRPSEKSFKKHPNLFYTNKQLLDHPKISLTVGYHEDTSKFRWGFKDYPEDNLKVKVISNKVKNYERKIKFEMQPQGKLLTDLKKDNNKTYEFSLLYNGLVIRNQYYITNNLSSLSNFNNGK